MPQTSDDMTLTRLSVPMVDDYGDLDERGMAEYAAAAAPDLFRLLDRIGYPKRQDVYGTIAARGGITTQAFLFLRDHEEADAFYSQAVTVEAAALCRTFMFESIVSLDRLLPFLHAQPWQVLDKFVVRARPCPDGGCGGLHWCLTFYRRSLWRGAGAPHPWA